MFICVCVPVCTGVGVCMYVLILGSFALSGNMLLVRIIENNKIDVYFRACLVKLRLALPRRIRKDIRIGPRRVRAPTRARNRKKTPPKLLLIILDPV